MTSFNKLNDFIQNKMKMSHIYQPLFIKTLLENNGVATLDQVAKAFLSYDTSQIDYYKQIAKATPTRVLQNHEIITKDKNFYSLTKELQKLSEYESRLLIANCDKKIAEYLLKRENKPFQHRTKGIEALSGSLRYDVIKRSGGKCEACGASSDDKTLHVDHIIPRNHGGSDDISNLQALCYECNTQKRDRDDTDFNAIKKSYSIRDKDCLFCNLESNNIKIIDENELALMFYDGFAVTKYHTLIVPKRHISDYFELYQPEINAINQLLKKQKIYLESKDKTISGFNVGINCGEDAGQSIFHVHVHLIPRRKGDTINPKGGVRGVIPDKQNYEQR